jgi:hypothetical protein
MAATAPTRKIPVLAIAIGLGSLIFAVGIGVLVFLMVRPRGERIGELSLTTPNAALDVPATPRSTLHFRVDVDVAMPRLSLLGDDVLERRVDAQLRDSLLIVVATSSAGVERSATCAVYNGRAMTTTITSGSLSRSGMLDDCIIALDGSDTWRVRGNVTWAPELEVRSATLEARLEAAPR